MRLLIITLVFQLMLIVINGYRKRTGANELAGTSDSSDGGGDDSQQDPPTDDVVIVPPDDSSESTNYFPMGDVIDPLPVVGYNSEIFSCSSMIDKFDSRLMWTSNPPSTRDVLFYELSSKDITHDLSQSHEANIYASALYSGLRKRYHLGNRWYEAHLWDRGSSYSYPAMKSLSYPSVELDSPGLTNILLKLCESELVAVRRSVLDFFSNFSSISYEMRSYRSDNMDHIREQGYEIRTVDIALLKHFASTSYSPGRYGSMDRTYYNALRRMEMLLVWIVPREFSFRILESLQYPDSVDHPQHGGASMSISATVTLAAVGMSIDKIVDTAIAWTKRIHRLSRPQETSGVNSTFTRKSAEERLGTINNYIPVSHSLSYDKLLIEVSYSRSDQVINYFQEKESSDEFSTLRLAYRPHLPLVRPAASNLFSKATQGHDQESWKIFDTVPSGNRFLALAIVGMIGKFFDKGVTFFVLHSDDTSLNELDVLDVLENDRNEHLTPVFSSDHENVVNAISNVMLCTGAMAKRKIEGQQLTELPIDPADQSLLAVLTSISIFIRRLNESSLIFKIKSINKV